MFRVFKQEETEKFIAKSLLQSLFIKPVKSLPDFLPPNALKMKKTIFITGTNSGFGLLTAKTLLEKGHTVIGTMRAITSRNKTIAEELTNFAASTEGILHLVELDVTDDASVAAASQKALEISPVIDALVNNAGIGAGGLTEGFSAEQFAHILNINVTGVHRLTKAFLPAFRKQQSGRIINVSSVMGRIIIPFSSLYTATKYALEGYTESLRYELGGMGIGVSLVEPGGFMTGFMENMLSPTDKNALAEYGDYANVPGQMWGGVAEQLSQEGAPNPQAVADAVADIITGEKHPPLRVVVDLMTGGAGPKAINEVTDQVQTQLLEGFGMGEMMN